MFYIQYYDDQFFFMCVCCVVVVLRCVVPCVLQQKKTKYCVHSIKFHDEVIRDEFEIDHEAERLTHTY